MTQRMQLTLRPLCWSVLIRGDDGEWRRVAAFVSRGEAEEYVRRHGRDGNLRCEPMPLWQGSDGKWYQVQMHAVDVSPSDKVWE